MKYIFPRQFGLHNVFTSEVNPQETVQPFKDYTLREQEIGVVERVNGRKCTIPKVLTPKLPSLPKRLRGKPMALVRRLQSFHKDCSYTELLKHYCPSPKLPGQDSKQVSFSDFATADEGVSAFCRAVISKVFPNELWGIGVIGEHNKKVMQRKVDQFIKLRRFESMTLHEITQGMKVRSFISNLSVSVV
jgi:telomerase reverse transcriptase